ncbi:MAG: HNH endonuclease [Pseudomonadota bacterium]
MALRAPRFCRCGALVVAVERCPCEAKAETARKAIYDERRPSSSARGYTSAWDKARKAYLYKHPLCTRCDKPASVVDHIKAHKGDQTLFWDSSNWQALCAPCHNGAKQREERRR